MVIENYSVNYQNYQNPPWILEEHWCIYSCLQIPPRENWFQNERREYARAINFPCLITMAQSNSYSRKGGQCYLAAPPLGAETPLKINASSFPGGAKPPLYTPLVEIINGCPVHSQQIHFSFIFILLFQMNLVKYFNVYDG